MEEKAPKGMEKEWRRNMEEGGRMKRSVREARWRKGEQKKNTHTLRFDVSPNKKLFMSDFVDLDTHLYIPAGSLLAMNDVLAINPRRYMKTYFQGVFYVIVNTISRNVTCEQPLVTEQLIRRVMSTLVFQQTTSQCSRFAGGISVKKNQIER